ncbi:MAG: PilZ domain-containing protein [Candidatus Adiutricales bacterium]
MIAQDRREFVRRPVDIPIELSIQGRFYDGLIKNMRNGGVFIKTKGRYSEGQDISMTIESPSEKRTGKIARVTPEGIGVEFNYPGYTR